MMMIMAMMTMSHLAQPRPVWLDPQDVPRLVIASHWIWTLWIMVVVDDTQDVPCLVGTDQCLIRIFPTCCQAPMKNWEVAIHTNPLLLISPPMLPSRVFCLSAESLNADSASSFLDPWKMKKGSRKQSCSLPGWKGRLAR